MPRSRFAAPEPWQASPGFSAAHPDPTSLPGEEVIAPVDLSLFRSQRTGKKEGEGGGAGKGEATEETAPLLAVRVPCSCCSLPSQAPTLPPPHFRHGWQSPSRPLSHTPGCRNLLFLQFFSYKVHSAPGRCSLRLLFPCILQTVCPPAVELGSPALMYMCLLPATGPERSPSSFGATCLTGAMKTGG